MKGILLKILGFLLLAGIVFGLFLVVFVPVEMWDKAQAETWPSRKAVVTTSSASIVYSRIRGNRWQVTICANYVDTGERVCADRIRYGDFRWRGDEAGAKATAARYPQGREIDIFHSPANPRRTVLEAHSPWTEMLTLLAIGIALLSLPVLLYVFRRQIEPGRYK